MRDYLLVHVNGCEHRVRGRSAFLSLTDFLRGELSLTGTKIVCSEGDCGACSVLVGQARSGKLYYQAANSCIQFMYQLDRTHIVTVEGLERDGRLHAVQDALVRFHGTQCGFCTPGFVTALAGLLEPDRTARSSRPGVPLGMEELRKELSGNLCRCTGYAQILNAARSIEGSRVAGLAELYPEESILLTMEHAGDGPIRIDAELGARRRIVHIPTRLDAAAALRAECPEALVVSGATDTGVRHNAGHEEPDTILSLSNILDLDDIAIRDGVLITGARATWSRIEEFVRDRVPEYYEILRTFGSPQIRHVATIGGNIANASPIADALPFLHVMNAEVELVTSTSSRRVNINDFYRGYKSIEMRSDELISRVFTPLPGAGEILKLYKVTRREDLDLATFTAGILVGRDGDRVSWARLAYGGVGPTVLRLPKTEAFLAGKPFEEIPFREAGRVAREEITPITDVRGSADFRLRLAENTTVRFFHELSKLKIDPPTGGDSSTKSPEEVRSLEARAAGAGEAVPHDSATEHVTGKALFIDDIPSLRGELHIDCAGSPCAKGRIRRVDLTEAAKIEGVVGLFTHADVPGRNRFGAILADESFLAEQDVLYYRQPVVVIAAETREAARRARRRVRIDVDEESPVLTVDEAIRRRQFIGPERRIARGNFDRAWAEAEHRLEGALRIGGQDHLYLESQAVIAYPGECGRIRVHASTQNPTELQAVIAEVLDRGMHEVVCESKRMGGAFGGKETQAAIPALMAALVASKTDRPARVVYTKGDDMIVTGKRHPYQASWKAAFDSDGRLLGVRINFYSNGGCAADLSTAVLDRTLLHADSAYYLPNVELSGRVCRTNLPPNTAFRGFGAPQAATVIENLLEEIAIRLGKDSFDVRRLNCYGVDDRNVTPYGQIVRNNLLPAIFDRLVETSDYRQRQKRLRILNGHSPSELRGIAMTAVKFGISFTSRFLNQGNALVNVYTDGTVQVSTGATEMGQGVNTKIRQLVAEEFGIAVDRVIVMATSTEKNNNTSPTAASASTDLNGAATLRACEKIKRRLAKLAADLLAPPSEGIAKSSEHLRFEDGSVFDERAPHRRVSFAELTDLARRERVDLGARGFYATPGVDFNWESGRGNPFLYYTSGCAVTEVLVNRFTGNLKVLRSDILMDIGRMINPGIDLGQVIGGFVQGMGWATTEELCYDDRGRLLSNSPTTYKIPNVTDLPEILNVNFADNAGNVVNIRGSKAVGEPPLLLGISAWVAAKHALASVRTGEIPRLNLPATGEEILSSISELLDTRPAVPVQRL